MNLLFRFRHEAKHLGDLLTFDGDHLEGGEKDSCENSNFKVGEQVAGTLAPTGDTKRTELKGTVTVGTTGTKTIRVPPAIRDGVKGHMGSPKG